MVVPLVLSFSKDASKPTGSPLTGKRGHGPTPPPSPVREKDTEPYDPGLDPGALGGVGWGCSTIRSAEKPPGWNGATIPKFIPEIAVLRPADQLLSPPGWWKCAGGAAECAVTTGAVTTVVNEVPEFTVTQITPANIRQAPWVIRARYTRAWNTGCWTIIKSP